jgi:cysteine-rich repeat protein
MRVLPVVVALLVLARVAAATCGDGVLEPPDEQCDDGNVVDGDCCSSTCQFEIVGTSCPDDTNPCTTDLCDGGGTCVHAAGNAGTLCRAAVGQCDLAETCTGIDTDCPVDAKSTAPCRPAAGICDVAELCDGVSDDCPPDLAQPDGTPCDDGDACTQTDACETGTCTGTDPVVCTPLDQCHAAGTCDPLSGACSNPAQPDGTPCDDGDACTQTDACETGACTGTDPVVCTPLDQCHAVGTCDPLTGACSNPAQPNGMPCDDGNACTQTDSCHTGTCTGTNPVLCTPLDQCHAAGTCDPLSGACSNPAQPDGMPCDDGNACTQTDSCHTGTCTGTNPVVCIPFDGCHAAGTCNPLTGECSNPERPDGTSCDDGNACTESDACRGGACEGSAVRDCCLTDAECSDGVACTVDACVSHRCMNAPLADRCGPTHECGQVLCAPEDPAADEDGCLVLATDEGSYCTEDEDPCTIDSCRSSTCVHTSDGSGPRCLLLVAPYRGTLDLVSRAQTLETAMQAATAPGCSPDTGPACELPPGQASTRLLALLDATHQDLATVAMALAGRLAGPASPSTPRDPVVRARLALGLLADTPANLRSVIATLGQARTRHLITRDFARARRTEARRILAGTRKLRAQLRRLVTRHQSFAR